MHISPDQIRAARALLRLEAVEVARRATLTEAERLERRAANDAILRRSWEKLKDRDDLLTDDDLYDENGLPH